MTNRKSIEAVWYVGRMMGETVAQTLTKKETAYRPGHWFNSAKFFDIEYQTYGNIQPIPSSSVTHFYWKDETKNIAMRFAYDTKSHVFLGVNTFGIRMRHQQFNDWLNQKATIDQVINDLSMANFDPEFYKKYEPKIKDLWLKDQK